MILRDGMKILAHVHLYPPAHNAGAEWMLHTLLREMVRRGHEARVLIRTTRTPRYVLDGVMCARSMRGEDERRYRGADVVITHLDMTGAAMKLARSSRKPLVHIVHNDRQLAFHRVGVESAQLVVWNSRWIRDKVSWDGESVVIVPPVVAEDYRVGEGVQEGESEGGGVLARARQLVGTQSQSQSQSQLHSHLSLINLNASKGAELFYELARRLPQYRFLGVKGSYGKQIIPDADAMPVNVQVVENTPDVKLVYALTKVLLMPSDYESWGRVGIEAAASGIPTIAHPTPGLKESLGDSGLFVDRDDVNGWVRMVEGLMTNPGFYQHHSKLALKRSDELDPAASFDVFEDRLMKLAGLA